MGLLHFTRLEGGVVRGSQEKAKGRDFGGRAGASGGLKSQIVEGLCSVVEGLCRIVEGLCKGGKCAKLLILHGPGGFFVREAEEKLPVVKKTARSVPKRNSTHSGVYNHSTVFG